MKTLGSIILTVMAFSLLGAEYVRAEDAKPSEKVTVTVSRGFPGTMNPEMILAQIGPDIPPPPGEDMEHEGHDSKYHKRHEAKIGMFLIWRMINDIDIRDDQLDKFFVLMRAHQKQERENAHELHRAKKALKELLEKDDKSDSDILKLTQNVIDMQKKIWEDRQAASQKLMKILDPEQKARFILSVSGIEDRVRDSIARIKYDPSFDKEKFRESLGDMNERLKNIRESLKAKGMYFDNGSDNNSDSSDETK